MKTVLDYLEKTGKEHPGKAAFADVTSEISFSELIQKTRIVGTALAKHVAGGIVIPFYLDKSTVTITGFIGAVYAGCAYSQINLRHPAARIAAMLELLQSPVVVTDREHVEELAKITDREILVIEDLLDGEADAEVLAVRRNALADTDPLYVNFTSGSTGTPKGVVVCHRNVVDFISEFTEVFCIRENDVLANQAPFDFDVSVKDIYSGIFTGARVEIIPTEYFVQPLKLGDFLYDRDVTVLVWAVSALCFLTTMRVLAYKKPEHIRAIMFSGEVMPIKHLKKLQEILPEAMYVNLYGPTEITCNCTYYILDREFADGDAMPIGIPFRNRKVFLLDEQNREVTEPTGVGELCVSGSCVALGYLRNPDKTREVFCQNPLNDRWDERIYRTGDLIRINENGEMVYFSRKDFQIKHLGHRIELTEIDIALQAVPGVDRACCQYLHKNGKILAFISGTAAREEINAELRKTLPEYMIPNIYMAVERMPINKNGKIDRQALMELYETEKRK